MHEKQKRKMSPSEANRIFLDKVLNTTAIITSIIVMLSGLILLFNAMIFGSYFRDGIPGEIFAIIGSLRISWYLMSSDKYYFESEFVSNMIGMFIGLIILINVAAIVTSAIANNFAWYETTVDVHGYKWEHRQQILDFQPREHQQFGNTAPEKAYNIQLTTQRSDTRIPDSTCETKTEWVGKYLSTYYMCTYVSYMVDEWGIKNSTIISGTDPDIEKLTNFDVPSITLCDTVKIGCEQLGAQLKKYFVDISIDNTGYSCEVNVDTWNKLIITNNSRARVSRNYYTHQIDCNISPYIPANGG